MRAMKVLSAALTAVVITATMSTTAAADTEAGMAGPTSEAVPPGAVDVSFDQYRALFDDLEQSEVPRVEEMDGGTRHVTFEIENFELTLADVTEREFTPRSGGEFTPNLGGGFDGLWPYVTFNQVDQTALLTGASAALVAGICLIPAVGTVACAVAGVVVAVATVYANAYGRCPNGGDLKVYVIQRSASCV